MDHVLFDATQDLAAPEFLADLTKRLEILNAKETIALIIHADGAECETGHLVADDHDIPTLSTDDWCIVCSISCFKSLADVADFFQRELEKLL